MALRYKKRKIVLNFDKENRPEKYVATNVLVGSIDYPKLCEQVHHRTGIHRAMVDLVLKGAQDTMITFLEEGFSVKLGEFGSFRPAINAESKDNESEVKASSIIRRKILFTPGSKFRAMLYSAGMELFTEGNTATESGEGSTTNETPGGTPDETPGGTPGGNEGEAPDPWL